MDIHSSPLHGALITRTNADLVALKTQAIHEAARYPAGSLRRRHYLGIVDRITAILRYRVTLNPPDPPDWAP